jgi:hypothetical protein
VYFCMSKGTGARYIILLSKRVFIDSAVKKRNTSTLLRLVLAKVKFHKPATLTLTD